MFFFLCTQSRRVGDRQASILNKQPLTPFFCYIYQYFHFHLSIVVFLFTSLHQIGLKFFFICFLKIFICLYLNRSLNVRWICKFSKLIWNYRDLIQFFKFNNVININSKIELKTKRILVIILHWQVLIYNSLPLNEKKIFLIKND